MSHYDDEINSNKVMTTTQPSKPQPGSEWIVGGGEMGRLIRAMNWSHTPLGPIASWPQSRRTTVNRIWREHPTPPDVVSTFVRAAMGDRVRWFYALTGQPCGSS